ncbi:zeta toxin family protein [Desulfitobacterium sp. Sab5]|uniref:zeta toxin family protein n=1 Tax=Desulfitobacterium nosdiversum TaxID=3375356 RepID=UPI003CF7D23D
MMLPYCRMLCSDVDVEYFVDNILRIDPNEKREAINSITSAERNMQGYDWVQTSTYKDYRDFEYRDEKIREQLRASIVNELIVQKRLDDDNAITLGNGGAAPKTQLKAEKKMFYVIGPPAAGKSGISNKIADAIGGYILDSDYAKRKLPEYKNQIAGASLVHDESDQLIFSYNKGNLLEHCIEKNYNIVIPKIGYLLKKVEDFCGIMKKIGYSVFLISVDIDRAKATQRAYNRFKESGRYVPLSAIFDAYANEPTLTYFRLKQMDSDGIFDGFAQISTDVFPPTLKEQVNLEMLVDLFKEV